MPANVQSLAAIETVRTGLAKFRDELDQALSVVDIEKRRVLDWLEHDRPMYWRKAVRDAQDHVTEARAALHRCLMYPVGDERPSCREERAALKKAEVQLAYCLEKSERLRTWIREVRHEMFEYDGRISQLRDVVEIDVPAAMAMLSRLLARLQEYQSIRTSSGGLVTSATSESLATEFWPERTIPEPAASDPDAAANAPGEEAT
jgi:hypothetical protein